MKKFLLVLIPFFCFSVLSSQNVACFSNPALHVPGLGGSTSRGIASGDLNNDSITDFVVTNMSNSSISLVLGNGNGFISSASSYSVAGSSSTNAPRSAAIADFDNDGKNDVVVVLSGINAVYLCKGNGSGFISSSSLLFGSNGPWSVASKDFNGDGNMDIVTANFNGNNISVGLGDGTGAFAVTNYSVGNGPYFVSVAKMDNDTVWDIVVANNTSSSVSVLLGNSNGTFSAAVQYSIPGGSPNPYSLTIGDFNKDGNNDVATTGHGNATFSVLLGSGTGTLGAASSTSLGGTPFGITCGYYDSDSNLDIAVSNNTNNNVNIYSGDGLGAFTSSATYTTSSILALIITGDYNGDGFDDMAMSDNGGGGMYILLNHQAKITPASSTSFCPGDSVMLIANHGQNFSYLWTPGSATNDTLMVDTADTFTLTITNINQTCSTSVSATTVINSLPVVSGVATPPAVCSGQNITLNGTGALTYTWSNGVVNGVPFVLFAAGTYTVTGTDTNGCVNTGTIALSLATPATPAICLVTTDSLSINNLIYWDKTLYANVDSFIAYRYDAFSNSYLRIGAVSKNSFSQFIDTARSIGGPNGGDPQYASWQYKIAIRDTCGNIGAKSPYHASVFIQENAQNFSWNAYNIEAGQTNPVTGYSFSRDDNSTGAWHVLANISGTSTTDPNYSSYPNGSWRVDALGFNCNPTYKLDPGTGTMAIVNTSRSNIKNQLAVNGIKNVLANDFSVLNNLNAQQITFNVKSGMINTLKIYDISGRLIYSVNEMKPQIIFSYETLAGGIYFYAAEGNYGTSKTGKFLVAEH